MAPPRLTILLLVATAAVTTAGVAFVNHRADAGASEQAAAPPEDRGYDVYYPPKPDSGAIEREMRLVTADSVNGEPDPKKSARTRQRFADDMRAGLDIKACIVGNKGCRCMNSQGRKIDLDQKTCEAVAEEPPIYVQ